PAFEDLVHSLAQEAQLPLNIDPTDRKWAQPEERAKIMRSFALEPLSPVAFILPLKPSSGRLTGSAWISEQWQLRREWLFIVPGDAPVGSRLPLSSLPRLDPTSYPHVLPSDPFAEPAELTGPDCSKQQLPVAQLGNTEEAVRKALAVEPRDGRLCVFMPPIEQLGEYLELLSVVESTAAQIGVPVHVEGYPPPPDPRLQLIRVTPDPGVIE